MVVRAAFRSKQNVLVSIVFFDECVLLCISNHGPVGFLQWCMQHILEACGSRSWRWVIRMYKTCWKVSLAFWSISDIWRYSSRTFSSVFATGWCVKRGTDTGALRCSKGYLCVIGTHHESHINCVVIIYPSSASLPYLTYCFKFTIGIDPWRL